MENTEKAQELETMIPSQEPRVKPINKTKQAAPVKIDKNDEIPKRDYRRIPTSWEEASPEDRMMITMREAGASWPSIQRAWEPMTGTEVGPSTLSSRYSRIIAHRTHPAEGDARQLEEEDVEKNFEKSGRQIAFNRGRKGLLPPFLQAEAKATDNRAVREAVIGAYLDAMNEAVSEALDEANENVDE